MTPPARTTAHAVAFPERMFGDCAPQGAGSAAVGGGYIQHDPQGATGRRVTMRRAGADGGPDRAARTGDHPGVLQGRPDASATSHGLF